MVDALDFLKPGFLKPRWKKDAKALLKGARKYIHYKRDLLKEDRIAEIESRRLDLKLALNAGDRKAVEEAGKQLRVTCEKALPRQPQQGWWEENVEVLFVALVIALGIRTYILQPFRIPTGSMQPTLNGIIIDEEAEDFEKPWLGKQAWDLVFSGKTYRDIVADRAKQVVGLSDKSWFLFTRTEVRFNDGSSIKLPVAPGEVSNLVFEPVRDPRTGREGYAGKSYDAGDPILRGSITTGDLVLVDKISYHFRRPDRGEVFVFDTRGIPTQAQSEGRLAGQSGGDHYIKRLVGLPGDELSIDSPNLLNHARILQEPGILRVARREGEYGGSGHPGYTPARGVDRSKYPLATITDNNDVFRLASEARPGMREYAAMGDNTANSLDSRYWGAVHEFNLAGPGWISLWPFGSGHWGFIR